ATRTRGERVERDVSGEESASSAPAALTDSPFTNIDAIVVAILVVAGVFDWLSGNPIHSMLLFAAAAALAWDAFARKRLPELDVVARTAPGARGGANRVPIMAALVGALAYSLVVGWFGRYSLPA